MSKSREYYAATADIQAARCVYQNKLIPMENGSSGMEIRQTGESAVCYEHRLEAK
jgi:hypothetical protein